MSLLIIAAAGVVVTGSQPATVADQPATRVDVAFEELQDGRNAAAVARIEANQTLETDDPARLINLGTAHARLGDNDTAARHFMAALASRTPYELELADGSWVDSRRAARMALDGLVTGSSLALK